MSEVISFRVSEELTSKFKDFCTDNNLKSPAAFEMMLNTVELENAKGKITSREAEINDFQHHAYCLNRSYLNALEMCENAEAKIRIEFAKQLDSQLDTIADLREKLKQAEEEKVAALAMSKEMVEKSRETVLNAEAERDRILKQVTDLDDQVKKLNVQIDNDKEIIELLKDKSGKYEADSIAYQDAKLTIESLKNTISELKDSIKDTNNNHALELKEIKFNHAQELSDVKTEMQSIINAKELELANVKAEADRKYYEAQQKCNEDLKKLNEELHELKSLNKDLINENEKLKEKLSKQEEDKENKKEEKNKPSPEDEGEQLSLL